MAEPQFGTPMSWHDYIGLVSLINHEHKFATSFDNPKSKHVKYMVPTLDVRDGMVFHVVLRGMSGEHTFDFRDEPKPLLDRIKAWLNDETNNNTP